MGLYLLIMYQCSNSSTNEKHFIILWSIDAWMECLQLHDSINAFLCGHFMHGSSLLASIINLSFIFEYWQKSSRCVLAYPLHAPFWVYHVDISNQTLNYLSLDNKCTRCVVWYMVSCSIFWWFESFFPLFYSMCFNLQCFCCTKWTLFPTILEQIKQNDFNILKQLHSLYIPTHEGF